MPQRLTRHKSSVEVPEREPEAVWGRARRRDLIGDAVTSCCVEISLPNACIECVCVCVWNHGVFSSYLLCDLICMCNTCPCMFVFVSIVGILFLLNRTGMFLLFMYQNGSRVARMQ